jgi:hypothetical protein
MAFLALLLQVKPLHGETSTGEYAPCCPHLYNALLNTLDLTDEPGAVRLFRSGAHTHFTVCLLPSKAGLHKVRVTVSGQRAVSAAQALLATLAGRPVVSCKHQSYQVLSVDLARTPLASVSTWADLLAPSSQPALRLRFVTPAIFTGAAEGLVQGGAFPQPLPVFSGLLRRWRQLGGPALAGEVLPRLQDYTCVVTGYRLQAQPIALRTETGLVAIYPGWKGWITFTFHQPQVACMSTLWTLARMACFTGVGEYTEIGLGVTQIVENRRQANGMARHQDGS